MDHGSTGERPMLRNVSIEFEQVQYYGSYLYDNGEVCVGWANPTDYTLHQLSTISSDPHNDAIKLLRQLLVSAKFRGEI